MKQIQTLIKTYHESDMGGHDINILHMSEIHNNFVELPITYGYPPQIFVKRDLL